MTEILTLLCVEIGFVFLPCVVLYLLFPVIQHLRKESKIGIDKQGKEADSEDTD